MSETTDELYGKATRRLWRHFKQGKLTAEQYKQESIASFAQWKGAQPERHEHPHWEISPSIGGLDARINPVTGFHDVTFSANAWTNLLSIVGYARACASLEQERLMEQGTDKMLAALRQADAGEPNEQN